MLYDGGPTLEHRVLKDDPNRPLSAMALDYRDSEQMISEGSSQEASQDVNMVDAGPSTAPLGGNVTFFHDD